MRLAPVSLSASAEHLSHLLYWTWCLVGRKSKREGEKTPMNSSGLATQRCRHFSRRSEILDLGSGPWSGPVRQTIRPDAWNGDRASETGKDGALLPSPTRRGKFAGKIAGKLQAGRREPTQRARDHDQLAPLPSPPPPPPPPHPPPPPPPLPPLSNATSSIVLVRGFCAVAIRMPSSGFSCRARYS